jgi:rod shape-determining protein MreD
LTIRTLLIGFLLLGAAAVLQMTCAYDLSIGPARPDFILTTIACLAAFEEETTGAVFGAWGGLLMGSVMGGLTFGSYLISRTVAGAVCGLFGDRTLNSRTVVGILAAFLGTLCGECLFYVMAPTHRVLQWAERVLLECLYDALLAAPLTLLLRRVLLAAPRPDRLGRPILR